ncbi:Lipoma HMGIC fusion partner [Folsomia candida]|uniref:Lipoma HMGIC fusion partner n=1 Tax=Folsomia candida TaxID=158441 RepID=A0A226EMJ1_FOLCA|nr:Lipoma HMGIC fusion partner [Folsomia candida]
MASTLTFIGIVWAFFSLSAALVACCGFYLPFWINGKLLAETDTSFGSFIRCGFPYMGPSGNLEITSQCGRYSSFWTIPSGWWRATTILTGTGTTLSLLVGLTACCCWCIGDIVSSSTVKFAGALQLFSGLLIVVGVALYPLGWGNKEVQDACDDGVMQSGPYQLGKQFNKFSNSKL